jgi:hypothetical protein
MKTKAYTWVVAFAVGSALALPPILPAAEKDMMKDEKGMMKEARTRR